MTVPRLTSCLPALGVLSRSSMLTTCTQPALKPQCASIRGPPSTLSGHALIRASMLPARALGEYARLPLRGECLFLAPIGGAPRRGPFKPCGGGQGEPPGTAARFRTGGGMLAPPIRIAAAGPPHGRRALAPVIARGAVGNGGGRTVRAIPAPRPSASRPPIDHKLTLLPTRPVCASIPAFHPVFYTSRCM